MLLLPSQGVADVLLQADEILQTSQHISAFETVAHVLVVRFRYVPVVVSAKPVSQRTSASITALRFLVLSLSLVLYLVESLFGDRAGNSGFLKVFNNFA